jgi:pimeloyl-ACP methyl ester carboxylesterase
MGRNHHPSPVRAAAPGEAGYREHRVRRGAHHLYAREYPGREPAVLPMHGFPDNLRLYDRLVPLLAGRRVVTFDFLGWGGSDKPTGHPYTATNQTGDLDAVVGQLGLGPVVLVAHDASGPPAIDWALDHPDRVAGLVLLNTYYCRMPGLRRPEAIWLFSTPVVRTVARAVAGAFGGLAFRRLYRWQVGRFFADPRARAEFLPLLYEQFRADPSSDEAFFRLSEDLLGATAARTANVPRLRRFPRPVRIVFGADDPYLNRAVARRFHELLPTSDLFLLDGARHFVQMDEPERVAGLVLSMPAG